MPCPYFPSEVVAIPRATGANYCASRAMSQRRFSPAPGREEALTSRPGLGAWGGWRSGGAKQFQSAGEELAELPVQEMPAREEGKHRLASRPHSAERADQAGIARSVRQAAGEGLGGVFVPSGQPVHLGQVQVELRLVAPHVQSTDANLLRLMPLVLGLGQHQAQVREVERVVVLQFHGAAYVMQRLVRVLQLY